MAKETITLPEFIVAYQDALVSSGHAVLPSVVPERMGGFAAPADTASTYNEQKSYPWIPDFASVTARFTSSEFGGGWRPYFS